jgi:hypothetical protein
MITAAPAPNRLLVWCASCRNRAGWEIRLRDRRDAPGSRGNPRLARDLPHRHMRYDVAGQNRLWFLSL